MDKNYLFECMLKFLCELLLQYEEKPILVMFFNVDH